MPAVAVCPSCSEPLTPAQEGAAAASGCPHCGAAVPTQARRGSLSGGGPRPADLRPPAGGRGPLVVKALVAAAIFLAIGSVLGLGVYFIWRGLRG